MIFFYVSLKSSQEVNEQLFHANKVIEVLVHSINNIRRKTIQNF